MPGDRLRYRPDQSYSLLPLRFGRIRDELYLVTNEVGEYVVLPRDQLDAFVARRLDVKGETYRALKSRHFLFDSSSRSALDLLALKIRTRLEGLAALTSLHMVVVTLRCDHSCHYCQVSRRRQEDASRFDMSREHAERAVIFALSSPSPNIKMEFQGGEPLLRFDLVRSIVERALELNQVARKSLQFVIATNLSHLTDEVLAFCKEKRVYLSTSLDGPEDIHDAQRPRVGGHSYRSTVEGIRRAQAILGPDAVSALMTPTASSMARVEEIVEEYARQNLHSVFLRHRSPYGFAARNEKFERYDLGNWINFFRRGLDRVIELNKKGFPMREEYASVLLQKILTPSGSNFVDLQSPAGLGIAGILYNYDGSIYASDEGRMLAEMGDHSFRIGHLDTDSFAEVVTRDALVSLLDSTMLEGVPMCHDCVFQPYCGVDPVYHKALFGEPVGHKVLSAFCQRQMAVLRHLIELLESGPEMRDLLSSWV